MLLDKMTSVHGFRWWVRGFQKKDLPKLSIDEITIHLTEALGIEGCETIEVYEGSNPEEICVRVWSDEPIPEYKKAR